MVSTCRSINNERVNRGLGSTSIHRGINGGRVNRELGLSVEKSSFARIVNRVLDLSLKQKVFYVCVWLHCRAYGVLAPWPGIEPKPPALEGRVLTNHWTTQEDPQQRIFDGVNVERNPTFLSTRTQSQDEIVCVRVKLLQSSSTLCNTVDCSPPGSSAHGILQARILEWVAISFPRGYSQPRDHPILYLLCLGHW